MNEYERWQDRFSGPDYAFGKEPNYFLKSCKQLLPRSGRALAVADGEGRNGVWLAEQGLNVLSIDFSPLAQAKARALAVERDMSVDFEIADVHGWNYPESEFDVVVEIFTQFSSPNERRAKWTGIRQTLNPGGLLILQGYTPKQIEYATGGPKQIQNLYTREMLEEAFADFDDLRITEERTRDSRRNIACRDVCSNRTDGAQAKTSGAARAMTTTHALCSPFVRRLRSTSVL